MEEKQGPRKICVFNMITSVRVNASSIGTRHGIVAARRYGRHGVTSQLLYKRYNSTSESGLAALARNVNTPIDSRDFRALRHKAPFRSPSWHVYDSGVHRTCAPLRLFARAPPTLYSKRIHFQLQDSRQIPRVVDRVGMFFVLGDKS